jgi:hypothetical protein
VRRWLWYVLPLFLVLAGLLVPALFANAPHSTPAATSASAAAASQASSTLRLPETRVAPPHSSQIPASTGTLSTKATRRIQPTHVATSPLATSATTAKPPTARAPARPSAGLVVSVAVVGKDGALLYGPGRVTLPSESVWGVTAMGALVATGLPYAMSTTYSDFVESIAGEQNSGMSGWMYAVDGKVGPVAANAEPVNAGDQVIWWYAVSSSSVPPTWGDLVPHH